EGITSHSRSVALFGLGFLGDAALCVYDQIEPDYTLSFFTNEPESRRITDRVKNENKVLIDEYSDKLIGLPLTSVSRMFSYLAELVTSLRSEYDITLIPMGPKPFVLSSLLCSM